MEDPVQIVLDTNVLVAGLRSNHGASHKLLRLTGRCPKFEINLSVPLLLEYEEVLKRESRTLGLTHADVDDVLNYLCAVARKRQIFFLWRPFLLDPGDDLILELAVESRSPYIVTFNSKDFQGAEKFGVTLATPGKFLTLIGEAR